MTGLLAIDPGRTTGWASFRGGALVVAGTSTGASAGLVSLPGVGAWGVLIEMPRWYPHDHKDVNDLLDLSVRVGELKHHYEGLGHSVELVWPRTWKGNAPKEITNRRTVEALTLEEVALLPRRPRAKTHDHNLLDAVGLGLWKLGRLP